MPLLPRALLNHSSHRPLPMGPAESGPCAQPGSFSNVRSKDAGVLPDSQTLWPPPPGPASSPSSDQTALPTPVRTPGSDQEVTAASGLGGAGAVPLAHTQPGKFASHEGTLSAALQSYSHAAGPPQPHMSRGDCAK